MRFTARWFIVWVALLTMVLTSCATTSQDNPAQPEGSESSAPVMTTAPTVEEDEPPATPVATDTAAPTETATPEASITLTPTADAGSPDEDNPSAEETSEPLTHIVRAGDTLWDIAAQYGTTVAVLRELNVLDDGVLSVGQEITLPGEGSAQAQASVTPTAPVEEEPEPAASPTSEPATALEGKQVVCATNALERALDLPADPIRIVISTGRMYMIAGGDLYELTLDELDGEGALSPRSLMPAERRIGRFTIQELVDVAAEPETGELVLLDKRNDIYRLTPSGSWSMAFESRAVPGAWPDPQFLALVASAGDVYALDADSARIWRFDRGAALPAAHMTDMQLTRGVDLTLASDGTEAARLYVLTYDGVRVQSGGGVAAVADGPDASSWPAQIVSSGGRLLTVDGQARQVALLGNAGQVEGRVTFAFEGMQRLRSAALAGDRLYAVAGRTLYMADLNSEGEGCPAVNYDDRYLFDGVDLRQALAGFRMPFPNAGLHSRPRSFPGARRLYRFGVHEGIDLYPGDAPNLDYGSAIISVADGVITRIDTDFAEITPEEYPEMVARIEQEHRTPPDILDRLRGRQVYVEHGPGIEVRYCHLTDVPDAAVGDAVEQGELVGTVGVSGTSSGVYGTRVGPHLHMEIWIHGRYLGHGLSIPETIRLWHGVFGG